jgi:tryptophan synthase alpha chain
MRLVAELARGYLYYVSLKGVTGAANIDLTDVRKRMAQIRSVAKLPVGVGFGIRDAGTARSVAQIADAVVIGSRIVQEFENPDQEEAATRVARLIVEIREAIDRPER